MSCLLGDKGSKKEKKKQFFVRSYIVIFHVIIFAAFALYRVPPKWFQYIGIFTVVWILMAALSYIDMKETP